MVDAFAAGDGAAVFGVVDKVIETGQDPRRFTEDLLRRLRDLVIVSAVPDAPATGLIDIAEDAAERLVAQAARFGPAELSRAADLVATGLTEMRGATAPRLLLELICARVLLPGADHSTEGVQARLDRLERRMTIAGGDPRPLRPPAPVGDPSAQREPPARRPSRRPRSSPGPSAEGAGSPSRPRRAGRPSPTAEPGLEPTPEPPPEPSRDPRARAAPGRGARSTAPVTETAAGSPLSLVDVRRLWPDIVEATKQRRRVTWIHLTQHAQVVAVDAQILTLGFGNAGARDSFDNGGSAEIVRQAAIDVVGHDWRVETIVDPGAEPPQPPPPPAAGTPRRPGARPRSPPRRRPVEPPASARPDAAGREPVGDGPPGHRAHPHRPARRRRPEQPADSDGGARPDDDDAESSGLDGAQLLQQALGAQVIEEIPHQ